MRVNYNPTQVQVTEGGQSLTPPPIGRYKVKITGEDEKETNGPNGKGKQLGLYVSVIEGEHAGKGARDGINIENPSPTATRIAQETLTKYMLVTGKFPCADTTQMHGIEFWAEMGPQAGDAKYGEVKKVWDIRGQDPLTIQSQFQGVQQMPTPFAHAARPQAGFAQPAQDAWAGNPMATPFPSAPSATNAPPAANVTTFPSSPATGMPPWAK
jgi:hypothetical protein